MIYVVITLSMIWLTVLLGPLDHLKDIANELKKIRILMEKSED